MIDTSSSMRFVQSRDLPPRRNSREIPRIKAIIKPLKAYIKKKAKAGDTLRIYTFAKPVELHQDKEKGLKGAVKGILSNDTILVLPFDKAKPDDDLDLDPAYEFVDGMHLIVGKTDRGRPTHLYESMDKILRLATGLIKDGKNVSILIISDGVDSSGGKPFEDLAAVMKNHDATITKLTGKIFCKIVKFKLKPADKAALEKAGVPVKDSTDLDAEDVFEDDDPEPKITITIEKAAFEVQLNKTIVNDGDEFWIHEKPLKLEFTLTDTTIAKKMGKEQDADQKEKILNYAWSYNPKTVNKVDINPGPNEVSLGPGDHSINLKVTEKTKEDNFKMAKALNFTIKEVTIDATIDGAEEGKRAVPQGGLVTFTPVFVGPKDAKRMWDYGDGNKGVDNQHIFQVPSQPGAPYKVIFEITLPNTLPNEEPIKFAAGSVQVTKLNAVAKAKPDNPWPGEEVTFTTNAKDVGKVVWNVDGKEMKPNGLNFALTHTFEMPGPVKVFAMVKQKNLVEPLSADASIVVKQVLPIIVVGKKDLFVGEETKYTITQADGQPFPAGFKVEVVLPEDGKEKPAQMIYFTKAGEYKVEVEVTPKGTKKTFPCKVAAILTVKEIKIEIGVKAKE